MISLRLSFILFAAALLAVATADGQSLDARSKATGSISGHIIVNGKPAAAIAIAAFSTDSFNRRAAAAQTKTDSEGFYRLTGLAAGQYQIATLAPNLTNAESNSDPFGMGFFYGNSKSILLAVGEEVNEVDLMLTRGAVITGRVTDAESRPVVEERVTLEAVPQDGRPGRVPYMAYASGMNVTDDRGIYRIYGLPAGRYKVSVGDNPGQGFAGGGNGYFQRTYYPDTADATRAEIIDLLEGSEATNIDIHLGHREETFNVSGRVIDSETGLPVTSGRVGFVVAPKDQNNYSPFLVGNPLGADGKFKIQSLAPGRYGAYISSDFDGGDVYSDPVYFDLVDKDVDDLVIRAVHGLTISGVIAAENLELKDLLAQLPGLRVSANVMPPDGRVTASTIRSGGSGIVAPDGSFQITGLRAGRASINVSVLGGSKRPSILKIEHDGVGITQGFDVQQSISGLRIVVAYGNGVIRGTVNIDGSAAPTNFRTFINCAREGTRGSAGATQTDARGRFVIRGLAPGTYECTLQMVPFIPAPGFKPLPPQKQFVNVADDAEAEITFVVSSGVKP